MLAHVEALVGGIDDDGVVHQPLLLEVGDEASHLVVDRLDATDVVLDVALVFPPDEVVAFQPLSQHLLVIGLVGGHPGLALLGRHPVDRGVPSAQLPLVLVGVGRLQLVHLQVVDHRHVVVDAHLLRTGRVAPGRVVVVEGLRHREFHILVEVGVFRVGHPVAMGCLVVYQEAEGLIGIPLVEELDGVVGGEGRRVALLTDILAIGLGALEAGVVIFALIVEHVIEIESFRLALHMPLTDDAGLVAVLPQDLGEEGLCRVDTRAQLALAVLVAIEAGHQAGPAGCR